MHVQEEKYYTYVRPTVLSDKYVMYFYHTYCIAYAHFYNRHQHSSVLDLPTINSYNCSNKKRQPTSYLPSKQKHSGKALSGCVMKEAKIALIAVHPCIICYMTKSR